MNSCELSGAMRRKSVLSRPAKSGKISARRFNARQRSESSEQDRQTAVNGSNSQLVSHKLVTSAASVTSSSSYLRLRVIKKGKLKV